MGGIGVEVYADIKIFDYSTREWKNIEAVNTDVIYIPEPRFGHTLNICNNHLVLFGGIGEQIPRMKSRKAFSDLRMFNMDTSEWIQQDFSRDGKQENKKRANHAAAIMGSMLVAHGGYNSEENHLYNLIEVFDIQFKKWTIGEIKAPEDDKKKKKHYQEADPFDKT
jgi:leucine-zipper-like transcriptional regulator 1